MLIREQPWYRRDAFRAGLKAAGFEVVNALSNPGPGDIVVAWNRYGANHVICSQFERAGATAAIAENGYLGAGGSSPKFDVHPAGPKPHHYYALGIGYHNDSTRIIPGGPERFAALGVELRPWRTSGEHVLILPNRSFGVAGRIMPPDWAQACAKRVGKATGRPVRIRPHPGNDAPKRPLSADLEGAWAAFAWTSGAGVHALAAGIPTFCEASQWILKGAGAGGTVDEPIMPDRQPHFERLAWGQWRIDEIETGMPFRHMLELRSNASG